MAGNETRGSPREGAFPRKWMMGLWKETQCLDQSQRRHRSGRDLRLGRLVWQDPAVRFCFYFMSMRVFPVCMSVPHVHVRQCLRFLICISLMEAEHLLM